MATEKKVFEIIKEAGFEPIEDKGIVVKYAPENLSAKIANFFSMEFYVLQLCKDELVLVPFSTITAGLKKEVNSIIILLSVLVKRGAASNFLGLVVGIALPFAGLYTMAKNSILRFLFPYSYIVKLDWNTLMPIIFSAIFVGMAIAVFKRMDL